ncbi:PEP-CTERM sorting domain-containing protein [Microcoleus vaginatus DQ-U2]|uniref:PEP-CTERM sorting domain-containing protein n=1 Tax=Microcoleus vaginatus TaxID=119532 RepID=UPI00168533BA|nr:PEP-CTERM sorting domain-containing protein [Microcoleus sp. FACHB-DQ6]
MTTLTLVKKTSFTVVSLATTMLLSICTPVRAFMFGTTGIEFDRDTSIDFTFEESHGGYQSSLWVAQAQSANTGYTNIAKLFEETQPSDNGSADNWKGTFGNAVTSENGSITQTFRFLKDQTYALLLWSDTGSGNPREQYVSSSTFMNSTLWWTADTQFRRDECGVAGCQLAVFGNFMLDYNSSDSFKNINGGKGPEQFSSLTMAELANGTQISFDDLDDAKPGTELDFNDFTVRAELVPEPVPEPVTVFGTMLGLGALAAARRKKKRGQ